MTTRAGIEPFLLEDPELRQADVGQHGVGGDGQTGPSCRARGRPVDALLGRRDPRLVGADLADDPRPDARLPHPGLDLPDELVGEIVGRTPIDQRVRRVVGGPVPAAAHDHVESAGARHVAKPERVTPDTRQGQVHQPAPADVAEPGELVDDDRLVARQLPVIPARLDVPQGDLGVLVRQGEPERVGLDRTEDGLDVGHGPRCYAVAAGSGTFRCAEASPRLARSDGADALSSRRCG